MAEKPNREPGILGIDPGKMGGIAVRLEHRSFAVPMSETEQGAYLSLIKISSDFDIKHCYYEKVAASPQMGVTSAFNFGNSFGFIAGLLTALKIPFTYIQPSGWQTEMGCSTGGDKKITYNLATKMFPYLNITHKTADALLIAEYGWRKYHGMRRTFGTESGKKSIFSSSDKKKRLEPLDLL